MGLLKGFSDTVVRSVFIEFYNSLCVYCRRVSPCLMVVDHIDPVCLGGQSVLENYCLACRECNGSSFKAGSPLPEPGRSMLLAMAKRNAPIILQKLYETRKAYARYYTRQQQLQTAYRKLPHGLQIKYPKTGNRQEAMVLYSKLVSYSPFHDYLSKGEMYRLIKLQDSEELSRYELQEFLRSTGFNYKQLKEGCRWLNECRVIIGRTKQVRLVSGYSFYNRNDVELTDANTLTKIFRAEFRVLTSDRVRVNFHNIYYA